MPSYDGSRGWGDDGDDARTRDAGVPVAVDAGADLSAAEGPIERLTDGVWDAQFASDAADATQDVSADIACTPSPPLCAAGPGRHCDGSQALVTCFVNDRGCLVASERTACGAGRFCSIGAGGASCVCSSICKPGATICTSMGVSSRTLDVATGCYVFGPAKPCGLRQICGGPAGSAACGCGPPPIGCNGPGSFCSNSTTVSTCEVDANGCLFISQAKMCPAGRSCTGTLPAVACNCNNPCVPGTRRCDPGGIATCAMDLATQCPVFGPPSVCGTRQTCSTSGGMTSCLCASPPVACAAPGTFCSSMMTIGNCERDRDGCLFISSTALCPVPQTCGGAIPVATCACPLPPALCAAGAGTYCADGDTLGTCSRGESGCLVLSTVGCPTGKLCKGTSGRAACVPPPSVSLVWPAQNSSSQLRTKFTWEVKDTGGRFFCAEVRTDKGVNPFDTWVEDRFQAGNATELTVDLPAYRYSWARFEWGVRVAICATGNSCPCAGEVYDSNVFALSTTNS